MHDLDSVQLPNPIIRYKSLTFITDEMSERNLDSQFYDAVIY